MFRRLVSVARAILPRRLVGFLHRRIGHGVGNINTREYWNAVWEKEGLDGRGTDSPLLMEIARLIPSESSVLDVGCGDGRLLRDLKEEKHCACVGLDISDSVLLMLKEVGIAGIHSILPEIPCPSNHFDVVIAAEVLEHLDDPQATLRQMYRVAKPAGWIIFSVPDGNIWGRGGEHVHVFDANDCLQLLRPFVKQVHILALDSNGWAHLLSWGSKKTDSIQKILSLEQIRTHTLSPRTVL